MQARRRRSGWKSWSSEALASETARWKISPEAELSRLSESGQQHTHKARGTPECGGPTDRRPRRAAGVYQNEYNAHTVFFVIEINLKLSGDAAP
jgi:hypothetical protein